MSVEDTIQANPKLAHLRATDPAAFNDLADIDTMLRDRAAWKDKPLAERFDAAVRMYEAANGDRAARPGHQGRAAQPADQAARVAQAVAKAQAEASGPSTLSDIPGGQPAHSQGEAMLALSGSALTDHFMTLSPDELEAQLARLSS